MVQPSASIPVSVVGAGSWGTALAALASTQCNTLLWARSAQVADQVNTTHANPRYLPGLPLPGTLRATHDLSFAVDHALQAGPENGLIILGVPVAGIAVESNASRSIVTYTRSVLIASSARAIHPGSLRISCAKKTGSFSRETHAASSALKFLIPTCTAGQISRTRAIAQAWLMGSPSYSCLRSAWASN